MLSPISRTAWAMGLYAVVVYDGHAEIDESRGSVNQRKLFGRKIFWGRKRRRVRDDDDDDDDDYTRGCCGGCVGEILTLHHSVYNIGVLQYDSYDRCPAYY